MLVWTIGAGGLLGSAVQRAVAAQGHRNFSAAVLPWGNAVALTRVLADQAARFHTEAGSAPWGVIWAAGRASTSSTPAQTQPELDALAAAIDALLVHRPTGPGGFLLASSAGGVYAGSSNPPFTAQTEPVPLSAYGLLKLAQEALVAERLSCGIPVVIGRFSNLYGPGQDLAKLQGLVSRVALAAVLRQPVTMFVPLDTMRDYIYADDAAAIALWHLERAVRPHGAPPTTEVVVIASGQSTPLGLVIHTVQDVARVRIPVAFGSHASARAQALDLRLAPSEAALIAPMVRTTLPAGIRRVFDDITERHRLAIGIGGQSAPPPV